MDRFPADKRHAIMRAVKGKNTKPELIVRRMLHRLGFRFRLHRPDLPGRPDVYLPKHRTAIFVNGCFWHGHEGCKRATIPATRTEFWAAKISANKERDRKTVASLEQVGIRVLVVWTCEMRDESMLENRLRSALGESLNGQTFEDPRSGSVASETDRSSQQI
ncbi:very short patch repair endonuclease [Oleispirillum naphthae]|uniref:very short patch repair endonuclease n=1 Tax=Oleispirillum naphthae TaxID=2838853 RepID=UPI00308248BF